MHISEIDDIIIDTSIKTVLRNNENFFLKRDDLKRLMDKKVAFWGDRNLTYKQLYTKDAEAFEKKLADVCTKLVRTDTEFDWLLLYANLWRIRQFVSKFEITDDLFIKKPYVKYVPKSIDEIVEIMKDYRLFDTETTGFWTLDQLTQFGIGIFKEKDGESVMVQKSEFYVERYKATVPPNVVQLTWITDQMVDANGKPIRSVLKWIHSMIHDQVICGHNISFDMDKITELFVDFKFEPPAPRMILDSIDLFKLIAKEKKIERSIKNYKLDTLTKFYAWIDVKELTERHTALFDVTVTHNVLKKAINYTPEQLPE